MQNYTDGALAQDLKVGATASKQLESSAWGRGKHHKGTESLKSQSGCSTIQKTHLKVCATASKQLHLSLMEGELI